MYYSVSTMVPIPSSSEKGKIVRAATGYVYLQTGYEWDPEKRQPKYQRQTIGKADPNQKGMMYPGKYYEKYFGAADPEAADIRKQYDTVMRKQAGKLDYHLAYGPYAAVLRTCEKAGCLEPLQRAFPVHWRLILAMALQAIAAESTTAQTFPGWCFDHYCGLNRVVSDSEISKMYNEIAEDEAGRLTFLTLYQKKYSELFPCNGNRMVAFDSTNQNYYGKHWDKMPQAKPGHEKIKLNLPVINTAMFVDEMTGIPLWYEQYDGSLLDKTQTPYSLKKIVNLGYRKLFVMYDRGYYQEENLAEYGALNEIEYGVLCPDGIKWVEDMIRQKGPEIKDHESCYVHDENIYGGKYKQTIAGKEYYAYLFYDSVRAEEERATIHEVFQFYYAEASKRKRYTAKMEKHYADKGILVIKTEKDPETGKNFMLAEDSAAIQELLDMKGFFVMVSPTDLTVPEAIRIIRKRDKAEKNFQNLMQHFDLRNTYRHKESTYTGMMFMAFIALIILSAFMHFETEVLHTSTSETVPRLFMELNKYKIEQDKDTSWRPAYAMNKTQKDIFAHIDLTEQQIKDQISTLKIDTKL